MKVSIPSSVTSRVGVVTLKSSALHITSYFKKCNPLLYLVAAKSNQLSNY